MTRAEFADLKLKPIPAFIRAFTAARGYPPTIREIAAGLKLSIQTTYDRLDILEARGELTAERGPNGYRRTRTLRVLE